jgi:hypothetical protein
MGLKKKQPVICDELLIFYVVLLSLTCLGILRCFLSKFSACSSWARAGTPTLAAAICRYFGCLPVCYECPRGLPIIDRKSNDDGHWSLKRQRMARWWNVRVFCLAAPGYTTVGGLALCLV